MADVKETVKDTFSVLLNKAQSLGKAAVETAKAAAEKGKIVVEEKLREREAERHFLRLGKKVYKLVKRNELTLPEACEKYIDALNDLYDEEEAQEMPSGEQEACCCGKDCECDGDKACGKDDCCCKKDECCCGKDCECDGDKACDKDECCCDKKDDDADKAE